MKTAEKNFDDLTVISGIGPTRQQLLRDSYKIHTYQDLGKLTNGELEKINSKIKQKNPNITLSMLKEWRDKAIELSRTTPRSVQVNHEINNPKIIKETNLLARDDGWKPFASFVVEFQTREVNNQVEERRTAVHHMEADTSMVWSGIERKNLCAWMIDQIRNQIVLDLEDNNLTDEKQSELPPAEKTPRNIRITQVRVFQPPKSATPSQQIEINEPFHGSIIAEKPFSLNVDFKVSGIAPIDISKQQFSYQGQSYVYDLAKGKSILLGETDLTAFEDDKFNYTFTLPEVSLHKGSYRMWILVKPQIQFAIPDYIEVSSFQVV